MSTHPLAGAQYLRSDSPEVVAIVEANRQASRNYSKAAAAFVEKYRVGEYHADEHPAWFGGGWFGRGVSAISSREKPTVGQWTRGYGGRGWRPFKNNPVYAEMQKLGVSFESYPGLPHESVKQRTDGSFGHMIYTMHPLVRDGVAWVDCRTPLDPKEQGEWDKRRGMPDPDLWREVKASEFYAAKEAAEAEEKAA